MSVAQDRITDYVRYVVESLVDDPETVTVTSEVEDGELFVDIDVEPGDRGRIIGRQGRLIRSLRVLVRAGAGRNGERANVEVLEDAEEGDDAGE